MLISALGTFATLLVELLLLFLVISYAVALINRRFGPERLQSWMAGGAVPGQVKGLALGAITPFCSCSTIPMFVSMLKAGVAFRTTVTYLIASPLLNPVIVGGIWLTLSWQVAISYAVIMVLLSLGAPWVWTALGMEDQLRKVKVKGGRQLDGTPWRGIKQETPAAIELAPKSWTGLILGGEGFKGLIPILHRGQALESLLDAFGVVPLDVLVDRLGEFLDGVKDFPVVHLGLHVPEEVLHYCVVVAVGFTRHRLDTAVVTDQVTPGGMLVLESLIGVHHPPRLRRTGRNRLSQ